MTILPKKKANKEKQAPQQEQQQQQQASSDIGSDSEHEEIPIGAAGGHSPSPERAESPGYHNCYNSPQDYYQRHYSSSGESSPELPVLSKTRYHPPPGAQGRVKPRNPPPPSSPLYNGYNSAEEYDLAAEPFLVPEKEKEFEETLKRERGFVIKKMHPDGACLFRAVADQVYGDQDMHSVVRNHCMDYMLKNEDYFSQFVTEDFQHYINRKRSDRCFGNNLEIQALAEMYNRTVELFQYSIEPVNIFFGVYKTDNPPIRLSYHSGIHYNSVVDPNKATIGVGLGLAGHKPGLADKNLMSSALKLSEESYIEQTMLNDKLRSSDWETTCDAIEQAVARESYLLWLREQEKRSGNGGCCSTSSCDNFGGGPSHQVAQSASDSSLTLPVSLPPLLTTVSASSTNLGGHPPRPVLRSRSRSRSSSRGHSPNPQLAPPHNSRPGSGRSSTRHSPRGSARNSPLVSTHSSPVGSPRTNGNTGRRQSPLTSRHSSPTASLKGSPRISPTVRRPSSVPLFSSPHYPSPSPSPPPGRVGGATHSPCHATSKSDPQLSPGAQRLLEAVLAPSSQPSAAAVPSSPSAVLDFESGEVLGQLPFEYSSFLDLPPAAFGFSEWDDDQVMAAVLAASQQEYLESLRQS